MNESKRRLAERMNSEGFSDEPKRFMDKETLHKKLKELLGDRFIPYKEEETEEKGNKETETDSSEKG